MGFGEVVAATLGVGVRSLRPVSGGDVAAAYRADLDDGTVVFVKTHADPPPAMFSTEAAGLRWLADAGAIAVPAVLAVADLPVPFLVLAWVEEGRRVPDERGEAAFGRGLAALHRAGAPCFGRVDAQPTGSLRLPTDPVATWGEHLAARVVALARIGAAKVEAPATLAPSTVAALDALAERLGTSGGSAALGVPDEPPARLHGDLWAGNRLVDTEGTSWLIDPEAHGGHRECDLAMMRLFGGFGADAFAAYHEAFPLADGWRDRVALHQVVPLAVHAIRFGGSYHTALADALRGYR